MMKLLAFVVTILVIVSVHEWGHYLAMRLFGVRVLKFSIGFGPRLLAWTNKAGTEFAFSAIPLGGYVKPLDHRDCEVPESQRNEEFSGKPAWQRIITFAAGPAANLVLAILLYWLVLVSAGTVERIPVLGTPGAGTAAAMAGVQHGDEVVAIDGQPVTYWPQVSDGLFRALGEADSVVITVTNDGVPREVTLAIADWAESPDRHPFEVLGLAPVNLPVIGEVMPGSAAADAGLQSGDRILSVDGEPVDTFGDWAQRVRASPEQPLSLTFRRDGRQLSTTLVPATVTHNGESVGQAGVMLAGVRQIHYGPVAALPKAFEQLSDTTVQIALTLGKLVSGNLSMKALGGPLTIADAAEQTASHSVVSFVLFLAMISVFLGVVNLLPIPMLDGGWIMFGLVEMVTRRELPERFLMAAQAVGMVLVFSLMAVAIFNDILRQFA